MPSATSSPLLSKLTTAFAVLAVAYVIALRLWFDITAPAMGDEAYYWIWGQKLGWSYFDHPPLDAWLQALVAAVFGWSTVSLRLLTWVTLAGTLAILWLWARRLMPADSTSVFWRMSAILMTVPVVALFTLEAFHDHLLVFFTVAALYLLWRFVERFEGESRGFGFLYAAAAALGLATLSKYNGALLGLGFVALLVTRRSLWPTLRTPHPYLAALLAIAIQAPVIYWNLTEGFATLRFHFVERPSNHWGHPAIMQGVGFVVMSFLAAGPVLLLSALRFPWVMRAPGERSLRAILVTVFLASSIAVLIASLFTDILLHWNIVADVALGLAGLWLLGRWLIWPQVVITLYVLTVAVLNYSVAPLGIGGFADPAAPANYGWSEVGSMVAEVRKTHPAAFLAATKYNYAAQLAFAVHDPEVTAINPLRSQYDLWWPAAAHIGQDAIVVADDRNPIELSSPWFASVSKLTEVPVMVGGKEVWHFDIYLGEGYRVRDGA